MNSFATRDFNSSYVEKYSKLFSVVYVGKYTRDISNMPKHLVTHITQAFGSELCFEMTTTSHKLVRRNDKCRANRQFDYDYESDVKKRLAC